MSKSKSLKWVLTALVMLTVVVYFGCEKKIDKTEPQMDNVETETIVPDTASDETITEIEPVDEIEIVIPDLKGAWTGTFDSRSTVLNITEQTDSSFSGNISIKYRETINQEVKGTFSPTTQKVSMIDQIHSRYMGKYDGKLSDTGNNLSGTFTMNRDGTNTSFNLNKK